MRTLNKRQKKAITEWFNANWTGQGSIYTIDQMPSQRVSEVYDMNQHETFYQNADRFINDLIVEKLYGV